MKIPRILLVAILATVAAPAGAQDVSPTAQRIFDQSFRRLQSYPVPPYAVWTATWHIRARPMGYYTSESSSVEVHRYAVRLADGMENISDPVPSGKLPPASIGPEFLGPFAWRFRSSVRVAPTGGIGGIMMQPDLQGLKTIARVVAVASAPYTVGGHNSNILPIDEIDGHPSYHLELHPKSDPQRHNLRDLWIDVNTYDVWKAHFVGTYAPVQGAPVSASDITVYFREVVGSWVVTRAIWTWDNAPISYTFDVTNDEIGLPGDLPEWLFEDALYRKHQDAGEADYLGALLARLRAAAPAAKSTTTPND